jgi:hypothetical protein
MTPLRDVYACVDGADFRQYLGYHAKVQSPDFITFSCY